MSTHTPPERLRCVVCDMPTLGDTLCNLHYEEQEKMTHTPGPWTVKPGASLPNYDGTPLQITANGRYIAKVDAVAGSRYQEAQNAADAAFIVRACNSHKAMLEALKGLVADWERVHGAIPHDHEAHEAIRLAEGRL